MRRTLFSLIICALSTFATAETIRLAISEQLYRAQLPWKQDMQTAFALAGHTLEFTPLPGKRALVQADNGIFHGDAFRGSFIASTVPNLTPIKVPVSHYDFYIWSAAEAPVADLAALQELKPIGISGFAYFDHLYPEINQEILFVDSVEDVVRILTNREDTYFVAPEDYVKGLEKQQLIPEGLFTKMIPDPIKTFPAYCFIHKDYSDLIPELEATFAQVFDKPAP